MISAILTTESQLVLSCNEIALEIDCDVIRGPVGCKDMYRFENIPFFSRKIFACLITSGRLISSSASSSGRLIISTPTGSTSYAMSLGAPILYPTMEAHIIVPIAAYRIGARPLVIPSSYEITAKLTGNPEAVMVLDGQEEILITIDDDIKLKKSSKPVEIVRFKDNFFERVRNKLRL